MTIPDHHKELAQFLKDKFEGIVSVRSYRDEYNKRSVPIASYELKNTTFYSTLGICDKKLYIPKGHYEFALTGKLSWLPNVLSSSIFWMDGRSFENWPLVCEDVVMLNVRSTYRHVLFVPSVYSFVSSAGFSINWLLGIPIKDSELNMGLAEANKRATKNYPDWLFNNRESIEAQ
jgi:hypothetical protein